MNLTALSWALPTSTQTQITALLERLIRRKLQGFQGGHLSIVFPNQSRIEIPGGAIARATKATSAKRGESMRGSEATNKHKASVNQDPESTTTSVLYIRSPRFLLRALSRGEIGFGEAYVENEWDSDDLVRIARLFTRNLSSVSVESPLTRLGVLPDLWRHRMRKNTRRKSRSNIAAHYDLGNEFYQLWLDPGMNYSCALFESPDQTLADAQVAKLDRLFNLLDLQPTDHLLDIGGGWGDLAIRAATTVGCKVTSTTISASQFAHARQRIEDAGLKGRIHLRQCDYRDLQGSFSKIVSVEMLEAVGAEFFAEYFAKCRSLLRPGGKMAFQTITMPDERYASYVQGVDWTQLYIFPGCLIPSHGAIEEAVQSAGLKIRERHEIGPHYAPTLAAWRDAFEAHLPQIRELGFDERFIRTWRLYLSFSEASFAEGTLGNSHYVLS
jgi:cyclopropane-fatty-acyl-phospholipid synthase